MDLGSLYISLLILKGLTLQQAQTFAYCAQTTDPAACYDSIPSQYDLQDHFINGDYQLPPQYTRGQFYHYVDSRPLTNRDDSACLPTPQAPPAHCY